MATSTTKKTAAKKPADDKPFAGVLSTFAKESEKDRDRVEEYPLVIDDKGTRVVFKSPDDIGTAEYMTVFGGGLDELTEDAAVSFFMRTMLSEDDLKKYLEQNPPLRVTILVMDAVRKHYEAQVPTSGESSASSD